jgi:hypothetical protein
MNKNIEYSFNDAVEDIMTGKDMTGKIITGKDGELTPLVKQLIEDALKTKSDSQITYADLVALFDIKN